MQRLFTKISAEKKLRYAALWWS